MTTIFLTWIIFFLNVFYSFEKEIYCCTPCCVLKFFNFSITFMTLTRDILFVIAADSKQRVWSKDTGDSFFVLPLLTSSAFTVKAQYSVYSVLQSEDVPDVSGHWLHSAVDAEWSPVTTHSTASFSFPITANVGGVREMLVWRLLQIAKHGKRVCFYFLAFLLSTSDQMFL